MKEIENRGRTLDAVVNPKNYPPFSKIPDKEVFETAWKSNPDWIFANMAHAAYCEYNDMKELFKKFGATATKFYESKPDSNNVIRGREAILVVWDDKAILSFRGTEADDKIEIKVDDELISIAKKFHINLPEKIKTIFRTDILDDAKFAKVIYEGSEVHGGFFDATKELWPDIKKDLDSLSISELFVTGHSLGAAMAVIAAMMHPFKEVVTFGEPSVGNNINKNLGGCKHIRFVNGDDPVTKAIPEIVYEHHSDPINIQDISGSDIRFDHSIISYAEILGEGRYSR